MYKLYYSPGAASFAVHWMLLELGVPFEVVRVDFAANSQKSAEYLKLNPAGQVPTLDIDGRHYSECAALLMILAERHRDKGFAPAQSEPHRAEYLELMIFLANNLLPSFRAFFYPQDLGGPDDQDRVRQVAAERIESLLSRLEVRLSDGRHFVLGNQFTAPDFLLTMLCRWSRKLPRPADSWPHLHEYLMRMRQRDGLRLVHEREGLTDWIDWTGTN